jgi:CheY-like chemotaxis protein
MSSTVPRPTGQSHVDLMRSQIEAIDAWHRARRIAEAAAEAASSTRESRLDLNRRLEARRREQQALLARAADQLRRSGGVLAGQLRPRAVLAHRSAWLRDAVAARLRAEGIEIVGLFDDGADCAGTVVVEQPDLLLVEDRLPTLTGLEVVMRAREFAPRTVVAAQALDSGSVAALFHAGAQAVFTRRVPPAEMVEQLLACLDSDSNSDVRASAGVG